MGHYAEALMTKGVLAKRGSMEQLKVGYTPNTVKPVYCLSASEIWADKSGSLCWECFRCSYS
jgi:hypothetical protein